MATKGKILIVDDEIFNREIYSELFTEEGYGVSVASNSTETFEAIDKKQPDIVLLDIVLHNESGLDILSKLKTHEEYKYIYVVLITGALTSSEHTALGLEKGADGYLTRPIDNREILARMEAYLRHKRTMDDLRKSEAQLKKIIDKNPDAILIVDKEGKISFANNSAEEMFKVTLDDLFSRVFGYPVVKGEHTEINIVRQDSQDRIGEMRTIDIEWEDKQTFLTSIRDITHLKKVEQDLKDALIKAQESDKLKSSFLANMSHEIRTPMNGILGFTRLLKKPKISVEKQKQYVSIIESSGLRMLNLINDIIDLSKIESGQMELSYSPTNLKTLAKNLKDFFTPETDLKKIKLSFSVKVPEDKEVFLTDNDKLYAILSNLIKNAIKYTDNGGISCFVELKDLYYEFRVEDTGIGIEKDRLDAIFERFVQADLEVAKAYEGAGLGLTIAKSYVEMLGGSISVESEIGKGTCFNFTIPKEGINKKSINTEQSVNLATSMEAKLKELTVLVADDDETSNLYLEELLEGKCKRIIHAINGKQAIEIAEKEDDIGLILMDIKMPIINGYEATKKIKEFKKDVIIIAQTAYAMSGDRQKAIKAGCNGYVTKPVNPDELLHEISESM